MSVIWLGVLLLLQNPQDATQKPAPEAILDAAPEYWIVVSPETKLMAGDQAKGKLQPGTLIRCSKLHGGWRFSIEYRGWVHSNDLVALDKAVEFFSKIIEEKPSAAAFHHRGIAYAALNEWDEALADFAAASERGDESPELLINLGNAQRRLNDSARAVDSYTKALTKNPQATYALLHRGSLLGELGHWDASLKDLTTAAELAPESSEIQNHLGVTLRMLGRLEDAIAAYSRAVEIVPDHAVALGNRGYALKCIGKYDAALSDYEASLKSDAGAAEVKNDLAWLLATCPTKELRNPQRAVELAESITKDQPKPEPDYLDTLAAAYAAAGKFDEAVATMEQSLQLLSGKPDLEAMNARLALYREKQAFVEPEPMEKPEGTQP